MSQEAESNAPGKTSGGPETRSEPLSVETGLEALRSSSEFRGPVEPLDGADANEHIALFYDSPDERIAATVPFVRQGIERGERVMYVIDEQSEADVLTALRDGGVDVDAATDSGALTFHSVEETYLRNGAFDPDEMLEFYAETIEATAGAYEGLRITAETNWLLDDGTSIEDFMAYESRVNDLFEGEDCIALCQYDRPAMPPGILADIVRTHPHLVYDGALCHNFYYTPPQAYFGPDEPARDVDRMLGTLVDRTEAKAELGDTIDELAESNERLKRFAYVASHDLQEPLRMISSFLQLLESRYGDELDEEAAEYIDFAVNGANRMQEMVDGLLSYSRIDTQDAEFRPVDCNDILGAVLDDLRLQIEETDAGVVVGDLPTVVGDPTQLEQVFHNLVANAIKYTDDGPPHVEIDAQRRSDRYVFSVADEGIGIDPAYADQIFEVFNRLHSTEEYQGTGIGLALCRKIVDIHDGDIWVDAEPDEGATFYFTLVGADR
ncbi:sensor histidine kinase [Natrinema marinum]|uniref:sensor histidine kinase n=1 Tax=Natrinema marinum TaxID=2961598 RepID=UPI0020C92E37|nr:MEDS domain-containing protein [Natrinema marinum]